jgi:hypothetical protein
MRRWFEGETLSLRLVAKIRIMFNTVKAAKKVTDGANTAIALTTFMRPESPEIRLTCLVAARDYWCNANNLNQGWSGIFISLIFRQN